VFLLRNENNVIATITAINTKQHGGANNEKLKLETLIRNGGANHQAIIIHIIINYLRIKKGWKSLKRAEKLKVREKTTDFLQTHTQSCRHGGFFGAVAPQTKLQAPPNLNMKHCKSVEVCQFFERPAPKHELKAPSAKTQSPPIENFLATVLYTLWKNH